MTRVAILISGGGSNMVQLLRAMDADFPARPCLVASNNPNAGGLTHAQNMGVQTAHLDHRPFAADRAAYEAQLQQLLQHYEPDIICLAGFMRILTPEFTALWAGKMLNIHPSLLPKYKGLHTHARALAAGDCYAGCSVHLVTGELDGGPILGQARVPILPGDDEAILAARVLRAEHQLYPKVLRRFVDGTPGRLDLEFGEG